MPYNTRRKSLSLPSLGIQLPNASRSHRPSLSKTSPDRESPPQHPPPKKIKRSHTSTLPSPSSSPLRSVSTSSTKVVSFADRPKSSGRAAYDDTPPPSPSSSHDKVIDIGSVNDEIVVGVIGQLEKTGNRPHLIKELAAVLSTTSDAVSSSANPAALLSSRLSAYLKRPWTPLSSCPLEKQLTDVHPRKVYYFLNTMARQPVPADSSDIINSNVIGKGGKRIISPSLSSASVDGDTEAVEQRNREALSPSPELEFSAEDLVGVATVEPNFTNPPTPGGSSYSERSSLARDGSSGTTSENNLSHNHRAASPPLEGDEKEFTQTASSMRMRGMSFDESPVKPSTEISTEMEVEETEEEKAKRNREAVEALFGAHNAHATSSAAMGSPWVKSIQQPTSNRGSGALEDDVEMQEPISILGDSNTRLTWDTREPEDIQLEDLDDLFGEF